MEIISRVSETKLRLRPLQAQGLRVALVPTMGALHEGHLSLLSLARKHAEIVVTSIFVNPKQFGPKEDLARYPRDLASDTQKLEAAGCDVLFAPTLEEMYPAGFQTSVEVAQISEGLCGAFRPGHFRGVTTVVGRLFGIVRPDVAVFGQKDFQQLAVIRRMSEDLGLDVEILGAPIVRDPDGLAMSSRNVFLSMEDRVQALSLSAGLEKAAALYTGGERSSAALLAAARQVLEKWAVNPEYLELRAADDLRPLEVVDVEAVILVAARIGSTRLIDNRMLSPK